jgi:ATP-dependent Lhr-like helicase
MELRGEVRRGYFVKGLSGMQYALPQAVEALRAARDGLAAGHAITLLSALDPVNLYGGESLTFALESADRVEDASPRFARVPSTHVVLWQGRPLLVGEDNGARLWAAEVGEDVLRRALKLYLERPTAPRRTAITTWNGGPVIGSPGETPLRGAGASRSPAGLDYWRSA